MMQPITKIQLLLLYTLNVPYYTHFQIFIGHPRAALRTSLSNKLETTYLTLCLKPPAKTLIDSWTSVWT